MHLDIIIPIYNPEPNWSKKVIEHYNLLIQGLHRDFDSQLIMVNDGSDRVLENDAQDILAAIPGSKWISYKENKGKGYALREGVKHSKGDMIMYTDYDFPYTIDSMYQMIDKLTNSFQVVVGNRDDTYYNHIPTRRMRISQYLKQFNRLLFKLPTDDTQCGLKIFKSSQKEIFLSTTTNRYLIDVEFLKLLVKHQSKVGIQAVVLRPGVKLSKISNLKLITELFNYLKIMLK